MGSDRRRAARIACRLPVRIKGRGSPSRALTKDLSRVGVRLSVPRAEFGIDPEADAQSAVRAINLGLGPVVVADFHYEVLGSLVRKGLRLVRMALLPDDPEQIELGFEFSHVLTDEEMCFLGVSLPEMEVVEEVAEADWEPTAPLCLYLCPADATADIVPLLAPVVSYAEDQMVVRISDARCLPMLPARDDVGARFEAVTAAYGSLARVLLVHGVRPVWFGDASVTAVYRPTQKGGFDVELGFDPTSGPAGRLRRWALPAHADPIQTEAREPVSAE